MDEDLVLLFEVAKKAADAAASAPDGGAEEDRCLDALRLLKGFPITVTLLLSTQVGKRLRHLTKHPRKNIRTLASDAVEAWKRLVIKEKERNGAKGRIHSKKSVEVESSSEKVKKIQPNATPDSNCVPPANHASMVKCNDPKRDKMRELLHDALSKVYTEASEDIMDEVNARDAVKVAVAVECAAFSKWGPTDGIFKAKYRSLLFNIKDSKNPDFRRKVLLGHIEPERIPDMPGTDEMASDKVQLENQRIKIKAFLKSQRGEEPKATTDQFRCGKCGQRKCTYHQLQTRSADEPMTTYVTCVNCNNHWKFC